MKTVSSATTYLKSLWILALLFVAQSASAQSFEGRVVQSISVPAMGDEKMEMVMNIKGDKMMIAMDAGPAGAMKMYSVNGGKSMIMVMEAMKMGYEINLEEAQKQANTASDAEGAGMKATGKKETINGYSCEEWTANIGNGATMSMWLTADIDKGLATAMQTAMKAQNAQNPSKAQNEIAKTLAEKGMIAVRTTITNEGEVAAVVDLVKIEKASIPDATFTPSKDITITKMPGMGQD